MYKNHCTQKIKTALRCGGRRLCKPKGLHNNSEVLAGVLFLYLGIQLCSSLTARTILIYKKNHSGTHEFAVPPEVGTLYNTALSPNG